MKFFENPLFGISLSLIAYYIGKQVYKKLKHPLFNPLLLAILIIIAFLLIFKNWVTYENYAIGGDFIKMFIGPATVILGISIYQKRAVVKKFWPVILASSMAGASISLLSVFLLAKAFNIEEMLMQSMLPKSVTAAIAIELSESYGGHKALAIICVAFTGIIGAILNPIISKKLRLTNKIALGLAIGVSSHVIGTSKAKELGETEGALSSVAIISAGFITALIYLFF